jgi:hypothetical protein
VPVAGRTQVAPRLCMWSPKMRLLRSLCDPCRPYQRRQKAIESVLNHRWARPSWIPILLSFGFASNLKCYLEHVAISMGNMEFKSIRNHSKPLKSIESWGTLCLDMFGQVEIPPKPSPSNDPSVLRSDFSMTWPRPCTAHAPLCGCGWHQYAVAPLQSAGAHKGGEGSCRHDG